MRRTQFERMVFGGVAAAALTFSSASTLQAQRAGDDRGEQTRAAAADQEGRGRGTYHEMPLRDLPEKAQTVIRKYAQDKQDLQVYRVTRTTGNQQEEYYEAAFREDDGSRMAMKVDRTGAVIVPPTELPQDDRNAAAGEQPRALEHVVYTSIPQATRSALSKEVEGAKDVDYMRQERGETGDRYVVHYTKPDGQRMQLWADAQGNLLGQPRPTRYQPEDRGDEQARARERERNRGEGEARPAAAGTGGRRGSQLFPLEPDQVPSAVERAFRQEADQNWERAEEASVFRVGENDYALQFQRGVQRYGMRVDRDGTVVTPLTKINREDRNPENPEREYFDPIGAGEVPKNVQLEFRRITGKSLEEAEDVKLYRVGEDDYLFRWADENDRQMAVRIDRELQGGQARAYEIPDRRENRDRPREREAQPAAARTGGADRQPYLQIVPVEPGNVPRAVEQAFRREADQNYDRARDVGVFRLGDGDYAVQFDRDGKRMGMRVDAQGKVVSQLREIEPASRDPEHPEREFFSPIERNDLPRAIVSAFKQHSTTNLDDANNVKLYRVGGDDYLIQYRQDGRQMGLRLDRDGTVKTGPYEMREARQDARERADDRN